MKELDRLRSEVFVCVDDRDDESVGDLLTECSSDGVRDAETLVETVRDSDRSAVVEPVPESETDEVSAALNDTVLETVEDRLCGVVRVHVFETDSVSSDEFVMDNVILAESDSGR